MDSTLAAPAVQRPSMPALVTYLDEAYLEVVPDMWPRPQKTSGVPVTESELLAINRTMERLKDAIKRHCDEVHGTPHPVVRTKQVCPFCFSEPEIDPEEGPFCCSRLIVAWEAHTGKVAQS